MTTKIRIDTLPLFDPAEYLKNKEDIAAYLNLILEENDPACWRQPWAILPELTV